MFPKKCIFIQLNKNGPMTVKAESWNT